MNLSPPIAFLAGTLSFLSPCVLPLVPVYLAILFGSSSLSPQVSRWTAFWHSFSFVVGFSLIFIGLGVSAGLIGATVPTNLLRNLAGALLLFFGLFLILAPKLPWLNYEMRLSHSFGSGSGYLHSLLVGAAFSLGWTPCVGPILGGILVLASTSQTAWQGFYLLLAYSLGLGIPFIIAGLVGSTIPLLKRLSPYSHGISLFSGILLMLIGVGMLTNSLMRYAFLWS